MNYLSNEAVEGIKKDVESAIAEATNQSAVPAGIPIDNICENRELIMGFLKSLAEILSHKGYLYRMVLGVVITAAETWFDSKCS